MSIVVKQPGALTTIQDEGRYGYQNIGITTSGAMDLIAMYQANALAGNDKAAAILEMTILGGSFLFEDSTRVAYSGADMNGQIRHVDGSRESLCVDTAYTVEVGEQLEFGVAVTGCRAYLAVAGGFDVPVVMNSRSTNLKCQIGGLKGRMLKAMDVLETGGLEKQWSGKNRLETMNPIAEGKIEICVVPSAQEEFFTQSGIQTFYGSTYRVGEDSDRMGFRMEGPVIETEHGSDIISDAISTGAIQIPANGQPIILMADHQTTGGYAKIGTVLTCDLGKLAQAKPGTEVSFRKVTAQEGQRRYLEWRNAINDMYKQ